MKLKVKNFKCYEEKEWKFPDEGMTLIAGMSGAGKSSILGAIHYALFGTEKKTITFGKTSSSVEFKFGGWKIFRSRRPNALKITNLETNEVYEDDEAQSILNETYGDAFDVSAYVKQNAVNSFIMMGGSEKMEFLEKFAFKREKKNSLPKIKEDIRANLRICEKEMDKCRTEKETYYSLEEEILRNESFSEISFTSTEDIKLIENKIKKYQEKCVSTSSKISSLKELLMNVKIHLTVVEVNTTQIERYENELKELGGECTSSPLSLPLLLEEQKKLKTFILLKNTIDLEKERIKKMIEQEKKEIEDKLETYNTEFADFKDETYYDEEIKECKEIEEDLLNISRLENSLVKYANILKVEDYEEAKEDLEDEIEKLTETKNRLELERIRLKCPVCNTNLQMVDKKLNVLQGVSSNPSNDVYTLEQCLKEIEAKEEKLIEIDNLLKKACTKKEIKDNIEKIKEAYVEDASSPLPKIFDIQAELKEYYNSLERRQYLLNQIVVLNNKLKDNVFSSSLTSLIKENDKRQNEYSILSKYKFLFEKEEKYQDAIANLKNEEKIKEIKKNIAELRKKINEKTYSQSLENIEKDISVEEECLTNFINKINEYKQLLETTLKNNKIYTYNELCKNFEESEKKFYVVNKFKEYILIAENIAISKVLDSININVNECLELFFPEGMSSKLSLDTEGRKSVNVEILHKGEERELNTLSGGEFSRVVLAFSLALAALFNVPMLMLDECTASLDVQSNEIVLEGIKQMFPNIPIIIVSHQASTRAIFDSVIEI